MDLVEELMQQLGGEYVSEGIKKSNTPSGAFIHQLSFGTLKKEHFELRVYSYYQKGIRLAGSYDGSPFKFVLILPFKLNEDIRIFPRTGFQKLFIRTSLKKPNPGASALVNKYRIDGNLDLALSLYAEEEDLCGIIAKHNIYIRSHSKERYSSLALRLNESATTVAELEIYLNILEGLGDLITRNKLTLQAWG